MIPPRNTEEFLPSAENQEPATSPILALKLYSIAGAKLKSSEEGLPTPSAVPEWPENRSLLV